MTRRILTIVAVFTLGVGLAWVYDDHTGPYSAHTCTAPCTVDFNGAQEDEVAWDYRHGGTVYTARACDHYCYEAMLQAGEIPGPDLILTDPGDRAVEAEADAERTE